MNKAINIKKTAPLEVLHSELPYTQDPTAYFMLFALGAATAYYWNLQKSTPSKI